jgi:hypothetical protein
LDQQAHLDLQAPQAQALLVQLVRKAQPDRQVDQQDRLVQQAQVAQQDLPVLVDQQAQMVQQAQQVPRLLFLAQQDRQDRKVLQLTLEDQLQIQQLCHQQATR